MSRKYIRATMVACGLLYAAAGRSAGEIRAEAAAGDAVSGDPEGVQICLPVSAGEILQCVLKHHPDHKAALMELEGFAAEVRKAEQNPNPELGSRLLGGGDSLTAEVDFVHTFETGGRRDARVNVANEDLALATSQVTLRQQSNVIQAALQLLRLRQVRDEIDLLKGAAGTYRRMIGHLRSRLGLSSEQRVSLGIYEVAAGEADLSIVGLLLEQERLLTELQYASGVEEQWLEPLLARVSEVKWPTALALAGADQSEEIRQARTRIARARASLELEEANAFPNLSIGPALEYRRLNEASGGIFGGSSSRSDMELGLSFRLTLPLYNRNEGGREAALAAVRAEQVRERGVSDRLALERVRLLQEYERARESIRNAFPQAALQTKHRALEVAIQRGRISPATVIEFHRNMYEYAVTLYEQEVKALRALLGIYALNGQILSKVEGYEIF